MGAQMRSPYERQPRHSPPPDDRDVWMARLDPTGERAAAELDRERRRLRSRMTDPDLNERAEEELARTLKMLEQSSPPPIPKSKSDFDKPNNPPLTDWSGALTFSDKETDQ